MFSIRFILYLYFVLHLMTTVDALSCSMYKNNEQILDDLSHFLSINPFDKYSTKRSYIKTFKNGSVSIYIYKFRMKIPEQLFCLSNVERFEVRSSSFENPNAFGRNVLRFASTLTQLIIHDTPIGYLTEDLDRMVHLRAMHLIGVGLRSIPAAFSKLISLVDADLSRNNLTDLPVGLNTMKFLRSFTASDNRHLTSVDSINGHPSLQVLRARSCSIRSIPKNLSHVSELDLSDNLLENINGIETIGQNSSSPKNFYFNKNKIRRIPPTIDHVRNLSRFFIDSNLLLNIPTQMVNMTSLTCVSFQNNLIDAKEWAQTIKAFSQKFNNSKINSQKNRC